MSESSSRARAVEARAKVNVFLRVFGLRDDGFHGLETLIVPISLADRLLVHADVDPSFRTLSLSLVVSGDPDRVRGVPTDESNLVLRAAHALAHRTGVRGFAEISLEKIVPTAAGLGGGSADAAATLRVLNELWACGLGPDELRGVGASVGSDVPGLMMGEPTLATGRGERVEGVPCRPLDLVLVTFPFAVSTPEAFRWWDEEGRTGPDPAPLLQACAGVDAALSSLGSLLFNDLEGPVIRRHPEIGEAKRILVEGGAAGAVMSGSGPTVVGLMRGEGARLMPEAEARISQLASHPPTYAVGYGSEGS